MIRRIVMITCLSIVLIFAAGCWSRQEMEDIASVIAVGIDKAEPPNKYRMTIQISVPSQVSSAKLPPSQEQRPTNWIVTSTGQTMFQTIKNFNHQVPRRLSWSNLQMIVFGEELAREGLREALDVFDRDPEPRRLAWMIVSRGAQAIDVMHTFIPIALLTAQGMDDFMNVAAPLSGTIQVRTFHNFLQTISAPGREPRLGPIQIIIEESVSPDQGRLPQGIVPTYHPRVGGTAVFQGDKLVGWLENDETRGFLFAVGEFKTGAVVVPCKNEDNSAMTVQILKSSSTLRPEVKGGKIHASLTVRAEGNIADQECDPRAHINELNERLAQVIEGEIRSALDILQKELRSDILGLGLTVHRRLPSVWRQVEKSWYDMFPEVPIDIEVKAIIRRAGLVTDPVEVR